MNFISSHASLRAVGISASPGGTTSRSRRLLDHALSRLEESGIEGALVDLALLPAGPLLGRGEDPALARAVSAVAAADILVVASPVYRASYSGLLKVFFDLLAEDSLVDKVALPIAAGGGPGHLLAIDHGLRPLLSSLGAIVIPGGVYATPAGFQDGAPGAVLLQRVDRGVSEALALAAASRVRLEPLPIER